MVEIYLGKAKVDQYRRTSLIKVAFDRMGMKNNGEIQFFYKDGEIIIRKANSEPVQMYNDDEKKMIMEKDDIYREIVKNSIMTEKKFKEMLKNGEDVSEYEGIFRPWYRPSERRFIEFEEMTEKEKKEAIAEEQDAKEGDKEQEKKLQKLLDEVDEEYQKRKKDEKTD